MVLIPVSCRKSRTPGVTRKFDLGMRNEAGQRLIEFCQENALVIANTLFQQHKRRLYTWTSSDGINNAQLSLSSEWSSGFPYFFHFESECGNKEFMIWATVSSWSCFCWLYRASPSLAAKNIINLISVLNIWWCPCVESSLVLLEEGVCYDQRIFLAKLY